MRKRQLTILHKKSNVTGKIPQIQDLQLGEIAINNADAKIYLPYTNGTTGTTEIKEVGWDKLSINGGTVYGDLTVLGELTSNNYIITTTGQTFFNSASFYKSMQENDTLVSSNNTGGYDTNQPIEEVHSYTITVPRSGTYRFGLKFKCNISDANTKGIMRWYIGANPLTDEIFVDQTTTDVGFRYMDLTYGTYTITLKMAVNLVSKQITIPYSALEVF